MAIKNVVLDFDGTCTQIPVIYKAYLERYLIELNKRVFPPNPFTLEAWSNPVSAEEWEEAQKTVRENSPKAGWTLAVTPSAPAAADPYILAYESAKLILRKRRNYKGEADPPFEAHRDSNDANPAPWRSEAKKVFEELLNKKINLYFISNSSSSTITRRIKELLEFSDLPEGIDVQSDASKFRISEMALTFKNDKAILPEEVKAKFEALSPVHPSSSEGRPVYLRRGEYFKAICAVLNNNLDALSETVFCGDIWEMDLAMPHALGANIHLIERATPFDTYAFEKNEVKSPKGKISEDLNGLLNWF